MQGCRALTGHVESPEKANGFVRNWSVFDFGRVVNCTDSLVMCVVCLFASRDSHVLIVVGMRQMRHKRQFLGSVYHRLV